MGGLFSECALTEEISRSLRPNREIVAGVQALYGCQCRMLYNTLLLTYVPDRTSSVKLVTRTGIKPATSRLKVWRLVHFVFRVIMLVPPVGIEPTTDRLKADCSTLAELRGDKMYLFGPSCRNRTYDLPIKIRRSSHLS